MKHNFSKNVIIIILGSLLTKVLGFLIKIIFTRSINSYTLSLYNITIPTYTLMITLSTFSLEKSISKLVSENKYRSKTIILSTIILILLIIFLIDILFLISIPYISINLLKEPNIIPIMYSYFLTLPFITISTILKGYFLGKLNILPNIISNVIEQLIRVIFLLLITPLISNNLIKVTSFISLSVLTEIVSTVIFIINMPKSSITLSDFHPNKTILYSIISLSSVNTLSSLIGSVSFFFEPIILTNILSYIGYEKNFILLEYSKYNIYALGLLAIPSFIINPVCQLLLPEISKYKSLNNYKMIKNRYRNIVIITLVIGTIFSIIIYLYKDSLLLLLYKKNDGSNYIKILCPFFILFYLERPLKSILEGLSKIKTTLIITLISIITKMVLTIVFSFFHIGIYSLIIGEIFSILVVVILDIIIIENHLKEYLK